MIQDVARAMDKTARVNLRINPNIKADTNAKITTGTYTNKFGIPEDEACSLARSLQGGQVELTGLTCHIGSQLTDLAPLKQAAERVVGLCQKLITQGHELKFCDLGGGLGIRYDMENPPSLKDYADTLIEAVAPTGLRLIIEPGRVLVGQSGVLVTEVIGIKTTPTTNFAVVDAAMNDLMRPAMYDSYHDICAASPSSLPAKTYDIVGPVCESADYLGRGRKLAELKAGDHLYLCGAGAYGAAMSSNYNSRLRPAEVMVDGTAAKLIRRRDRWDDLWAQEVGNEP